MQEGSNNKNLCNDNWLKGLVDAMDEVEAGRADDICRLVSVPAGLLDQLYGRAVRPGRACARVLELA